MRIRLTSVFVDDQDKALKFYTEVLGFVKKADVPVGDFKWLTVVSADEPDGVELLLEPNDNPAAKTYQADIYQQGIPAASFAVEDIGGRADGGEAREDGRWQPGAAAAVLLGIALAGELEQIGPRRPVEPQRLGQPGHGDGRERHVATLFEPCVPGDAEARELRHLLASEARRPASPFGGKPERGGFQPLSLRADEIAEFAPRTCLYARGGHNMALCLEAGLADIDPGVVCGDFVGGRVRWHRIGENRHQQSHDHPELSCQASSPGPAGWPFC